MDTFKQYGAGVVKEGDYVDVTLPIDDYQSSNWSNVVKMEKVIR